MPYTDDIQDLVDGIYSDDYDSSEDLSNEYALANAYINRINCRMVDVITGIRLSLRKGMRDVTVGWSHIAYEMDILRETGETVIGLSDLLPDLDNSLADIVDSLEEVSQWASRGTYIMPEEYETARQLYGYLEQYAESVLENLPDFIRESC